MKRYMVGDRLLFTADLHLGHDKPFIWQERGYQSVQEHDEDIIRKFNSVVGPDDTVYILGDVCLGGVGKETLSRLNGHITVILGNHDTDNREKMYRELGWETTMAARIKYGKKSILLTHYPSITSNIGDNPWDNVLNLHGHTHSHSVYIHNLPYAYHVGVDAQVGYPISIEEILLDFKRLFEEAKYDEI